MNPIHLGCASMGCAVQMSGKEGSFLIKPSLSERIPVTNESKATKVSSCIPAADKQKREPLVGHPVPGPGSRRIAALASRMHRSTMTSASGPHRNLHRVRGPLRSGNLLCSQLHSSAYSPKFRISSRFVPATMTDLGACRVSSTLYVRLNVLTTEWFYRMPSHPFLPLLGFVHISIALSFGVSPIQVENRAVFNDSNIDLCGLSGGTTWPYYGVQYDVLGLLSMVYTGTLRYGTGSWPDD